MAIVQIRTERIVRRPFLSGSQGAVNCYGGNPEIRRLKVDVGLDNEALDAKHNKSERYNQPAP
jgi:hypothetical protein